MRPLDVAHRFQVLGQLARVARTQAAAHLANLLHDRVEQAAVALQPHRPHCRVGAAAVSEHPLEHHARVVLHRLRRGRAAPGQRVAVGAAVAAVARPVTLVARLQRQLQRAELRLPAELAGQQLVDRDVRAKVVTLLAERPRDGAGQILRGATAVHRAALGRESVLVLRQTGQDQQAVSERLQRLEDRRELEGRAVQRRGPLVDDHAVRDVHHPEALDRSRGSAAQRRQRRHHSVEQRQRHGRPDTAQHRAAGKRLAGDDHDSVLRI